jgi:hypothetical protein
MLLRNAVSSLSSASRPADGATLARWPSTSFTIARLILSVSRSAAAFD